MAREPISALGTYRSEYVIYTLYIGEMVAFIGATDQPKQRIKELQSSKPWGPRITHFDIEVLPGYTKAEAMKVRSELIAAENPRFNEVRAIA
jgi:hypothetical protein